MQCRYGHGVTCRAVTDLKDTKQYFFFPLIVRRCIVTRHVVAPFWSHGYLELLLLYVGFTRQKSQSPQSRWPPSQVRLTSQLKASFLSASEGQGTVDLQNVESTLYHSTVQSRLIHNVIVV